jgi:arginyl-tRNA synthetase
MTRQEIKNLIEKAIKDLQEEGFFPNFKIPEINIGSSGIPMFGDYSSAIAIQIRKDAGKNPVEIANKIKEKIKSYNLNLFLEIKIAEKPVFINFFLSENYLQESLKEILGQKAKFGGIKIGKNKKINVEFISANPTGPLTLGNGRGGFCGDVLASILNKAGFKAKREYYVNDTGEQIRKLGHSVIGDDQAVYKGEYINELKKKIKGSDPEKVGKKAAEMILNNELLGKEWGIKKTIKEMGIDFDKWFFEESLYKNKEVDKVLDYLKKKGLTFEKEGALWFKSTQFGDDKDRVLVKSNGEKTYIASDIAYLKNKFERNFEKLIFFWGADHYGYINRIKAAAEALGYKKEQIEVITMQMVSIVLGGEKMRMSKREGIYKIIQELIEDLGLDVVRFFFLTRSPDSQLVFDLDLAKEKSEKNPVYSIQYAHARICSIVKKLKAYNPKLKITTLNLKPLILTSELELIKE